METKEMPAVKEKENPTFSYTVDGESQTTHLHVMTPVQIMQNAGVDPNTHYLVQMIGNQRKSYKDNPNEEIHMHNHMTFFTNALDATPVA